MTFITASGSRYVLDAGALVRLSERPVHSRVAPGMVLAGDPVEVLVAPEVGSRALFRLLSAPFGCVRTSRVVEVTE